MRHQKLVPLGRGFVLELGIADENFRVFEDIETRRLCSGGPRRWREVNLWLVALLVHDGFFAVHSSWPLWWFETMEFRLDARLTNDP